MILTARTFALVFFLTGAGLALLLREPLRHPAKPGSKGFSIAVAGIALWPLALGATYLVGSRELAMLLWNGRLLAAGLVSVGWFLVAFEFTTLRLPSRRVLLAFGAYLFVGQVIAWSNPMHGLVLTPATTVQSGVLDPAYGPWFWVQTVLNYGLIVSATAMLAVEYVDASGLRRRQAGILALAVVPPIAANLLTISDLVVTPHDLTPFGLVGSGVMLSWVLYRMDLLEIVPVARETALEQMADAVVTLDAEGRVVDSNTAARELFDFGDAYYGAAAAELFPDELLTALEGESTSENTGTEVTARIDGEARTFSLSVSPVGAGDGADGRVVVLRDITLLKRRERALRDREEELDLLRQVLSRVLRHNLRNELTTIRGTAETLQSEYEDDRLGAIVDASDDLVRMAEKVDTVERILQDGDTREQWDLAVVAADARSTVAERCPSAGIELSTPEQCHVEAPPGLDVAVENLVENAAVHNPAPRPSVWVTVTDGDRPTLSVRDDGPGIPREELSVLERRTETPLSHCSGVGLWLVELWAEKAGADVDFETGEDGSTVTVRFPADAVVARAPVESDPRG